MTIVHLVFFAFLPGSGVGVAPKTYQHTLYTSVESGVAESVTLGAAETVTLGGNDNVTLSNGGGLG